MGSDDPLSKAQEEHGDSICWACLHRFGVSEMRSFPGHVPCKFLGDRLMPRRGNPPNRCYILVRTDMTLLALEASIRNLGGQQALDAFHAKRATSKT